MTELVPHWIMVAPLLGVLGCANVWGFDDLTLAEDGGPRDATTPVDDRLRGSEDGGNDDAEVDAFAGADASRVDAGDAAKAADARSEAGEGGSIADSGPRDAGRDAPACEAICMGCCDSKGICQAGTATGVCGTLGGACQNCSTKSCPLTESGCCGSGACGCAVAGVIGCN